MKKHRNKIIILIVFTLLMVPVYFLVTNKKTKEEFTHDKAKEIVQKTLSNEYLEDIKDEALVVGHTKDYMVLVVKEDYIFLDLTRNPAKIHHFRSNKPDIEVKVLEIQEDRYLVEHDDHTHWIEGSVAEGVKVGDTIFIKDPHTYLQDMKDNH